MKNITGVIFVLFFGASNFLSSQNLDLNLLIKGDWYDCDSDNKYREFYFTDSVFNIFDEPYDFKYRIDDSIFIMIYDEFFDNDTFLYKMNIINDDHLILTYQSDSIDSLIFNFYRIKDSINKLNDYSCDLRMSFLDYYSLLEEEFTHRAKNSNCFKDEERGIMVYDSIEIIKSIIDEFSPKPRESYYIADFKCTIKDEFLNDSTIPNFKLTNLTKTEDDKLIIEIDGIGKCYANYRGLIDRPFNSKLKLKLDEWISYCDNLCEIKLLYIIYLNGFDITTITINGYKLKN